MTSKILDELNKNKDVWIALRQKLHQYPELGFEEHHTSDIVAEKLKSWGYDVHRGFAKTGVVGTLKVGDGQLRMGIRADMDALPIQEQNDKSWISTIPGKFHGCGHDGHTTILLCAAEYLARTKNFNGTLHVIFQPAEELLYGGKVMMDDGLFTHFPCDIIFALHNMPGMKTGEFYFRKGAMMASSDTVHIEIRGVGGHGAIPEKTIDAGLVACYIAIALQSIVSRNVSPQQAAVITVGCIQSGSAPNVINDFALLKLTVRALNPAVRQLLLRRITDLAHAQAASFGATAEIKHVNGSPVLINDATATDFAISVANKFFGSERVHTDTAPLMGSEDFAFMLEQHPRGCYLIVGDGDKPDCSMVHSPDYIFDDSIIAPAAAYWCHLTESYLK
ncbi:M20 aminoacylase family protein [Enterobacillus tribolii]|nr:M20 aminoacylase family protein [Enterobacillus tribolii]MBW7984603.1 amidohydrolase [Enterobacillus tribolii]